MTSAAPAGVQKKMIFVCVRMGLCVKTWQPPPLFLSLARSRLFGGRGALVWGGGGLGVEGARATGVEG